MLCIEVPLSGRHSTILLCTSLLVKLHIQRSSSPAHRCTPPPTPLATRGERDNVPIYSNPRGNECQQVWHTHVSQSGVQSLSHAFHASVITLYRLRKQHLYAVTSFATVQELTGEQYLKKITSISLRMEESATEHASGTMRKETPDIAGVSFCTPEYGATVTDTHLGRQQHGRELERSTSRCR